MSKSARPTEASQNPADSATPAAAPSGKQARIVLSLLALYLIWSSTYLALRVVVESLPPMLMVSGRFLCAGLIMTVVLAVRGAPWPTPRELAAAIPGGVLFFLIGNGLVAVAEQVVPSGVAALLCATMPLCAAAINALSGQRPRRLEWLGLLLGFAGVVTLCLGKELRANLGSSALLLLAPIGWALGSTVARRMPMAKGLMAGATQMLTGGAAALVVALLRGEHLPAVWPLPAVLSLGYLVVFGSLVAFSAYTYLLSNTRPALAMSYAYVNPGLAVLLGALLGHETLAPETLMASGLIVVAVVLIALPSSRRSAAT